MEGFSLNRLRSCTTLLASCFIMISILSACGNSKQTLPRTTDEVPSSLAKNYKLIDELIADATEISEINVVSQETMTFHEIPFTISTVSVLSSFKGIHKAGDIIRIIETGGEFTPTDKEGNALPKQTMKFNGIPVLAIDDHEVIFLAKFTGPQVDGEVYVPVGVYQGRFKLDKSGQLTQQAPINGRLGDYSVVEFDVFVELLKAKLSNEQ
jgi:hypothetical protein